MPPLGVLPPLWCSVRLCLRTFRPVRWPAAALVRGCGSYERSAAPLAAVQTTGNLETPPADHRTIGVDQELFTTSPYSAGSPLFLPNGASVFIRLVSFLRAQYKHFGFREVITPTIYKKSLWERSGHWENYQDDIFEVRGRGASGWVEGAEAGEAEEYGLKPMNCPGHCLLFKSRKRHYRELPIRYADFSALHRNEISGALSGLTRVRRFHQDDGHIFCRPSQILAEISSTLDFVAMVYKTFSLPPFKLVLSTRPKDHYIGTIDEWDRAEDALRGALENSGRSWSVNDGDGAFYGPKIDIVLKDSDGKEHQTATIQLDFQLPQRFDLVYSAPAPDFEKRGVPTDDPEALSKSGPVRPVIVHRAILGSLERFMALIIEHCKGKWPFWLSPRQAIILTTNTKDEDIMAYARVVQRCASGLRATERDTEGAISPQFMDTQTFHVDFDSSDRSMNKRVSEAKRKRYNMIIVVGQRNIQNGTVNLDLRGQPHREGALTLLGDVLGLSNIANMASVEMTPEALYQYFCRLGRKYQ